MRNLLKIKLEKLLTLIFLFQFFFCTKENAQTFFSKVQQNGVSVIEIDNISKQLENYFQYEEILSLGAEEPEPKLYQPLDCLVDKNGNLYFSDEGRIKKFDSMGNFLQYIGNKGEGPGEIYWPSLEQTVGDSLIVG